MNKFVIRMVCGTQWLFKLSQEEEERIFGELSTATYIKVKECGFQEVTLLCQHIVSINKTLKERVSYV